MGDIGPALDAMCAVAIEDLYAAYWPEDEVLPPDAFRSSPGSNRESGAAEKNLQTSVSEESVSMPKEKRVSDVAGRIVVDHSSSRWNIRVSDEMVEAGAKALAPDGATWERNRESYEDGAREVLRAALQATPPDGRIGEETHGDPSEDPRFERGDVVVHPDHPKAGRVRGWDWGDGEWVYRVDLGVSGFGEFVHWPESRIKRPSELEDTASTQPSDGRISVELTEEEIKAVIWELDTKATRDSDEATTAEEKLRAALTHSPIRGAKN